MRSQELHNYLLVVVGVFLITGILILASASSVTGQNVFSDPFYYVKHQLLYGILPGMFGFFIFSFFNYRLFRKIALPLFLFNILLMVLVFVPGIGFDSGGSQRWISAGFFSFQPSEILKFSFIIYLSAWIAKKKKTIREWSAGLVPFLFFLLVIGILLMLQPDMGTFGIIAASALLVYFIGGARYLHIALIFLAGIALFVVLVRISPYRLNRILSFFNPETDTLGISYQINQALLAIGSGGVFGVGFGQSRQKYNYLPQNMEDSIFAILGEELGFVGVFLIISLLLIFIYLGFQIAKKAKDPFGFLLASGITGLVAIQAFVNIGAISGLMPLTGVPLPFISYGGTSLAVMLSSMGALYNVARRR